MAIIVKAKAVNLKSEAMKKWVPMLETENNKIDSAFSLITAR